MGNDIAIKCTNLTKNYGSNHGIFDVNLTINQGSVFGMIGPNGAGKSTFIRLLMDLIKPTSGSVSILGLDSQKDSLLLKSQIGFLPGELLTFPSVTAEYILKLLLNLRGIENSSYLYELAERLDLDLTRKFQDLSHGNKQKVGLIQTLMHKPNLLILDEPTLGLDPIIQRELRNLLIEFNSQGKTIILSSHVLSEVESLCDQIVLINEGRVIRQGTLAELRASQIHKLTVIFDSSIPSLSELEKVGALNIQWVQNTLSCEIRGSIQDFIRLLAQYSIVELDSRELSLEEVFFSEVG
ncbi:MAG: hypothetical protein RIS09_224, partial [Actinomycetota bacterium]